MSDPILFALAVIAVLATPGPTNTLLMTGASVAGRRALVLLPAELAGYLVAVLCWRFVVSPITGDTGVASVLKIGAGIYLLFVASRVWIRDGRSDSSDGKCQVVRTHEVGIATLLNPKALIFALVVFPPPPVNITFHLALFAVLVPLLGACWVALGMTIRRAIRPMRDTLIVQRIGATVTGTFAAVLIIATLA